MAIIKIKQIRTLNKEELAKRFSELKLELLKEMGNVKMGRPIKNPGHVKELRRTIAKIKNTQTVR